MACLCEFVEANRTEICSGWRPLFGTLRVANSKHNASALLEVFRIFLSTDNTLVFANAALDYILCLLSHIRNTNTDEYEEKTNNSQITNLASNSSNMFANNSANNYTGNSVSFTNNSVNNITNNSVNNTNNSFTNNSSNIFMSNSLNSNILSNTSLNNFMNYSTNNSSNYSTNNSNTNNSKANNSKPNTASKTIKYKLKNSDSRVPSVDFLDLENCTKTLTIGPVDFCLECLKMLQNCATILSMMYNMPKCPSFNINHRMNIETEPQLVDPVIPNIDVVDFNQDVGDQLSYRILATKVDVENCENENITLPKMDRSCGILKIWYILLEGLSSAIIIAAEKNQPYIIESFFKLIKDLIVNPGVNFGLYCINHLLLPMVQNWLRQNSKNQRNVDVWLNFKHCTGLTTEVIVDYLHHVYNLSKDNSSAPKIENPAATLALKQLVLILVECIAQPNENIARLGLYIFDCELDFIYLTQFFVQLQLLIERLTRGNKLLSRLV